MAEPRAIKAASKEPSREDEARVRVWIAQIFTRVEDVVYIGLAAVLAGSSIVLLGYLGVSFVQHVIAGTLPEQVVGLLDRALLVLMIVEVLYTVQVSFREHALVPEPFLIVGLIAAIRRILVLTAEFAQLLERGEVAFRNAMMELGLLTLVVVALVAALLMLRRRDVRAVADRA